MGRVLLLVGVLAGVASCLPSHDNLHHRNQNGHAALKQNVQELVDANAMSPIKWLKDRHADVLPGKPSSPSVSAQWLGTIAHAHVQSRGSLISNRSSIPRGASLINRTTTGGCYQCTDGCLNDVACTSCRQQEFVDVSVGSFCANQKVAWGFQAGNSDTCGQCSCCTRKPHFSCQYQTGICGARTGVSASCSNMENGLSDIIESPQCSHVITALQNGNGGQVCDTNCFTKIMNKYSDLYSASCITSPSLTPEQLEQVLCGTSCATPVGCVEVVDEVNQVLASNMCHTTSKALDDMTMTQSLCEGSCYKRVLALLRSLQEQACFQCDNLVFDVDSFDELACGAFPSIDMVVSDDQMQMCATVVAEAYTPLISDIKCSWVIDALERGNMTRVCGSTCFSQYLKQYTKVYSSGCMVDPHAVDPAGFNMSVCQMQAITTHPSAQHRINVTGHSSSRVASVSCQVSLPISDVSPDQFLTTYSDSFIRATATSCGVATAAVRIINVTSGSVVVTFEIISLPSQGQETLTMLQRALQSDIFTSNLNDELAAMSATFVIPSILVLSQPTLKVVSECDDLNDRVTEECIVGSDECLSDTPSSQCCSAVVALISAKCDSDAINCGTSPSQYLLYSCYVGDELGELASYYDAAFASPAASQSPHPSPSPSSVASRTPDPSITPSPSVTPSESPIDVFGLEASRVLRSGQARPTQYHPYWGHRQVCHGEGDSLECICTYGYTGDYCEIQIFESCPSQCSDRGVACSDGQCQCERGFFGVSCNRFAGCRHLNSCLGHGYCDCGGSSCECTCDRGYQGQDCSRAEFGCPNYCSNHGWCHSDRRCECDAGYQGTDCSSPIKQCTWGCSGHGQCNTATGQCQCHIGFTGELCEYLDTQFVASVARGCSGRGWLNSATRTCKCSESFTGNYCEKTMYDKDCEDLSFCSGHGTCNHTTDTCQCQEGFTGEDCSQIVGCPGHCSGHGKCMGTGSQAKCHCRMAWTGEDCSQPRCALSDQGWLCSQNGLCEQHGGVWSCVCGEGFTGEACGESIVVPDSEEESAATVVVVCGGNYCSGQGVCLTDGSCDCFEDFTGDDCSLPVAGSIDAVDSSEF